MAKINKTYKPGDEFTPDSVNEIIAAVNKNIDDIKKTCATKTELKEAIRTAINSNY